MVRVPLDIGSNVRDEFIVVASDRQQVLLFAYWEEDSFHLKSAHKLFRFRTYGMECRSIRNFEPKAFSRLCRMSLNIIK